MMLKYAVKKKYMVFEYSSMEENKKAVSLLSNFLKELSKEQKVFVHSFQLPEENVCKLLDVGVVLEKSRKLLDPDHAYFYLNEAKIDVNCLAYATSVSIYYFDKEVEWPDFLATSEIRRTDKCIKYGVLSALFTSKGSEYRFICNRMYEQRVMQFLKDMYNADFEIKRVLRLPLRTFLKS